MVDLPMDSQSFSRKGVEAVRHHADGAIPEMDSSLLPPPDTTINPNSRQGSLQSIEAQFQDTFQPDRDFAGQVTSNTPVSDLLSDPFPSQISGTHQYLDWGLPRDWQQPQGSSSQGGRHQGFGPVPNITLADYSAPPASRVYKHEPLHLDFLDPQYKPAMADEPSLPSPRSDHGSSPHPIQVRADSMTPVMGMRQDNSSADESMIKEMGNRKHTEVPRNEEGKITCIVPGCVGRIFERKCEWTKHMDKHERPYRCIEPGCEKLRGFTYSGGLLRHQREVHKKHGGPKELLMCPVPYCKRNTGTGFTRKENRDEHIRRVHRQLPGADGDGEQRQDPIELLVAATQNPTTDPSLPQSLPYTAFESPTQPIQSPPPKTRKRKSNTSPREAAIEIEHAETARAAEIAELRNELDKLRRDNEEKDSRISRLEETVQVMTLAQHQVQLKNDNDVTM
ncbi:MAG: hypothetical protein M1828_003006 [Chrysothrix sp. TS-e1954]|nr:MAG: hypothetical protein M1828_003006 [Chrysothrix sp. TS-e1954]